MRIFREMKLVTFLFLLVTAMASSCKKSSDDPPDGNKLYYPPLTGSEWTTITPGSLGWDTDKIAPFLSLLEDNGTRAFILLKDGKIVMEHYFGTNLTGTAPFGAGTLWYWASAGKVLTATLAGIAEQEELLQNHSPVSDYLGDGWTAMSPEQEAAVTVWHQLTMTCGFDDSVNDNNNTAPEYLQYLAAPGTRWAYHNAPYTLLEQVISSAVSESFSGYFDSRIKSKTGMDGLWAKTGHNNVYYSTARSMARYGLLILGRGKWGETTVIEDDDFFESMITTSQQLNRSYGYLWWLNGKESFMVPELRQVFPGNFNPSAPDDMISGIGKNGQYVSVVPSMNIVLIRMGDNPDAVPVPFLFLDDIWSALNEIIR